MNNYVFVDSSAILAIINNNDQDHNQADNIYKKLFNKKYYFVLTNFAIAETHALLLSKMNNIQVARDWLSNSYKEFNILRPEEDMEFEAIKELNKYQDKDYSFTDMLSFLAMEKSGIQYFFSFDKHFRQIGKFQNIIEYI